MKYGLTQNERMKARELEREKEKVRRRMRGEKSLSAAARIAKEMEEIRAKYEHDKMMSEFYKMQRKSR